MSQLDADQSRWEALIDREAIGEPLEPEEREFVARHEAAHPELARERAIFEDAIASLREQLDSQDDELTLAREAQAALVRYRSERAAERARDRRPRVALVLTGLAAAAGLALWVAVRASSPNSEERLGAQQAREPSATEQPSTQESQRPTPTAPTAPVDPIGRLSMVTSDLPIELGTLLEPGASVDGSIERACVSWSAPTAVVCFEGELHSAENPELGERRVRLESGRLVAALAPLGPGQRFTVETSVGTISAIGTVFAVELYEGRAWVTVLEGRVELRDPTVRMLSAGHRTSLRSEVAGDEPAPLVPDSIPTALAQLVGVAELLRASPGDARLIIPMLGEQILQLDGHALAGPAQLALAAGDHAVVVLDDGKRVAEQAIVLEQGATLDLAQTLPTTPAPGKPSTSKPPSAKQLAEAAQRERAARNYDETARLYRELLRRYPDSPEAANVPVRLGDLLGSTGDHRGALEAYELYLERGAKQLAPEAEYGRIKALRALARKADERAAIEAFLAARPDDYRCAELQARLAELAKLD